jgi:hypothetical protein
MVRLYEKTHAQIGGRGGITPEITFDNCIAYALKASYILTILIDTAKRLWPIRLLENPVHEAAEFG